MPVDLLPPITSAPCREPGTEPLRHAPRYVTTDTRNYWHRPRSGVARADGRATWTLWCGQLLYVGNTAVGRDEPPVDGRPVCATCDGRALGAGQDDDPRGVDLAFEPRYLTPPAVCPGARKGLFEDLRNNVGRCLACGQLYPLRAAGGPYNPHIAITRHRPGPGLIPGCPFHAWQYLAEQDGRAICGACAKGRPW